MKVKYFLLILICICINYSYGQVVENISDSMYSNKPSLDTVIGVDNEMLSKHEAKKIAKIFIKKKLGWKQYYRNKPYKAVFNNDCWFFYSSSYFNKKFKRTVITTIVNATDGRTVVFIRK